MPQQRDTDATGPAPRSLSTGDQLRNECHRPDQRHGPCPTLAQRPYQARRSRCWHQASTVCRPTGVEVSAAERVELVAPLFYNAGIGVQGRKDRVSESEPADHRRCEVLLAWPELESKSHSAGQSGPGMRLPMKGSPWIGPGSSRKSMPSRSAGHPQIGLVKTAARQHSRGPLRDSTATLLENGSRQEIRTRARP